jgi:predicted O-methyltransferase YrrM
MLDEAVLRVLGRLEAEDRAEREANVAAEKRSRQIEPTTGRFLFALAAAQPGINVLELGGSRGYSAIWLAAGARIEAGRVVSIERDAERCHAWRANVAEARLEEWAELVEGDAFDVLRETRDTFDLVFLDAEKEDYEPLFALARPLLEVGGLVLADNVVSHADPLAAYSLARQADPSLSSVTLPLDRGLELTTILAEVPPGA